MREEQNILDILARLESNDKALKTTQKISGDSWIPYSYSGSVNIPANGTVFLIFTRDQTDVDAVVKMNANNYLTLFPVGARAVDGVHFWKLPSNPVSSSIYNYDIISTHKGAVTTSSVAPF